MLFMQVYWLLRSGDPYTADKTKMASRFVPVTDKQIFVLL